MSERRYFDGVTVGDEVYGFIYGKGKVIYVLDDLYDFEGFYSFEVEFGNGETVYYTKDGVPNWCNSDGCVQTVYWRDDIDLVDEDFSASEKELSPKKIMKLNNKGKLEMKCPSGIWRNVKSCPENIFLGALTKEQFYLFRKA